METSLATQGILGARPDVYAAPPDDALGQYQQYEKSILAMLQINLEVLAEGIPPDLDDEAGQVLCSWPLSQQSHVGVC